MALHVGFTGTQQGMTPEQQARVKSLLIELNPAAAHHGDCIGADAEFHAVCAVCLELGLKISIHPPVDEKKRAFCQGAASVLAPKKYLVCNHDIVNALHVLIGAPSGMQEKIRSGTWATVRYARKIRRSLWLVFPDGATEAENWLTWLRRRHPRAQRRFAPHERLSARRAMLVLLVEEC